MHHTNSEDKNVEVRPVRLQDVVDELELIMDDYRSYVRRSTGEVVTIPLEVLSAVEEAEQGDSLILREEWGDEVMELAEAIFEFEDFIALPDRYDIHEWSIMEAFAESRPDDAQRDNLLHAIRGSGAFRRFKHALHRFDISQDWHRFRTAALEQIAVDFLESHGMPYIK